MEKITIQNMPKQERPYEKCLQMGPEHLSDTELLAIIIRTGSKEENSLELSQKILALNYPNEGILGLLHLSLQELLTLKGIGMVKGVQLLCVGELSKRIWKRVALHDTKSFSDPLSIVNFYMEDMRHKSQEEVHLMLLNNKHRLIHELLIFKGTVNTSMLSVRELMIEALRYQAVYMVLIHNHPSGDPTPSKEDVLLTKKVTEAGELIGIFLLDHIVVGDNAYISFKERGLL